MNKIKKLLAGILAWIPSPLPNGMAEFEVWASSIIYIYDFPDNDSVRFALASMIMHSGPTEAYKPKRYFGLAVKAASSKQIAGEVFRLVKERQQTAIKQEAEATANKQAVASHGPEAIQ